MTHLLDRLTSGLADRYRVDREIGRGGMAQVFVAHDLKLDRPVALKVLRPDLAAVLGGERFLREITLAAKLEHPHILGIHDSGEADGILYYVMPYVEGESLRQRMEREKQLPLDDALQIAREVADALSYAHSQGVIHRDIKPENILLEAGHAVVADFGIARAIDAAGGARLTETGVTLGTPAYMSPEQAGGSRELDGRSDLYSLGCVLHEMLAGQPPFVGPTVESVVAQHLSAQPPEVSAIRPSVPSWVVSALQRSLAKAPADRFNPVALFGEAISPRASVAEGPPRATIVAEKRRLLPGVLSGILVIAAAVVLYRVTRPGPIAITTSNIVQVTLAPGVEFQPAISPDGEDVAYVVGPLGNPRLVVRGTRDIGGGGETHPGEEVGGRHWFPTWTPNGSLRFFVCQPTGLALGSDCRWNEVGSRGGTVRTIPHIGENNRLSPDGTRVVAKRRDSIIAYAADDGTPELLGVHTVDWWTLHSFAWSPDGRRIAYVNGNPNWRYQANVATASIWIIDAHGGEPVRVTDEATTNVSPQWLPDSRHLLFVSDRDGPRGIYVVEVGSDGPLGPPRSVPGPSDPHSISVSADGRRLAYAKFTWVQNIWSIPIPRSGSVSVRDAIPVTTGNQVIESHSVSPDGQWIVFDSDIRGEFDIYRMRLEGGLPQPVANLASHAYAPKWSPDGAEIAFYSSGSAGTGGMGEVFVVSVSGATRPEQLTHFRGFDNNPDWSPDGLAIAYQSAGPQGADPVRTWTVSRDSAGGQWSEPVQLTDFACFQPAWDPGGASLVCDAGSEFVRVSKDGDVLSHYEMPPWLSSSSWPEFSRDGSRIYFYGTHEDGSHGLWWIPADGGDPTKIVAFDDPMVHTQGLYSVGPEHLYLTVAEYESDIWVMDLEW